MKRSGFTLLELMVAIVCAAVVVFLVVLFLKMSEGRAELSTRISCAMNLSNMGKALGIYANNYNDQFPFVASENVGDSMWLMVKEEQPPSGFKCRTDPDDSISTAKDANGNWKAGFDRPGNVSYSWQAPIKEGGAWTTGILVEEYGLPTTTRTDLADSNLVIMADKAPSSPVEVNSSSTPEQVTAGMSPMHDRKYINYLRLDYSVQGARRPDCGVDKDCIYTAQPKRPPSDSYLINAR